MRHSRAWYTNIAAHNRSMRIIFCAPQYAYPLKELSHVEPHQPNIPRPCRALFGLAPAPAGLCRARAARRPVAGRYRHQPLRDPVRAESSAALARAGLGEDGPDFARTLSAVDEPPRLGVAAPAPRHTSESEAD